MRDNSLWQEALDLTHAIFSVSIGVRIDSKDNWKLVSYYYLVESSKVLIAVYRLLADRSGKDMLHPADILIRALFEFAVRLKYMDAHPDKVADFLEWSDKSPKRPWGNLKDMSKKVGLLDHWDKFYEFTSQKAHGSSQAMASELHRLITDREIPDWEPASILVAGTTYYKMVVDVNIKLFPNLEANFANFQPGTDWENRLKVLEDAIIEAASNNLQESWNEDTSVS